MPKFVIMEKISKAQVKLVRSLQLKKFRDELGLFVAEGDKCVSELCKSFEAVSIYREGENATHTEIEQMSGLRTPQGVIGVFRKPSDVSCHSSAISHQNIVLALDGVQDPGNLGTIIRTCDWFGVHDIVCSLDVYKDVTHYSPEINTLIITDIGSDKHVFALDEFLKRTEAIRSRSAEFQPAFDKLRRKRR